MGSVADAPAASIDALGDALRRASAEAPFLAQLIEQECALATELASGRVPSLQSLLIDEPDMPVARRLRFERRRVALVVAICDLAGVFDLCAVTQTLSDFADYALDMAIRATIEERTPGAQATGFTAIALGKQGSRELNYSSDIDPILLFDPATLPCRPREVPEEAAVRIARRTIELLQARDGDGYVLRVDLRLRPSPEATPVALSVDAAISYYESMALPWERAAFIRARAAAGHVGLGQAFLESIRPFVWRRGLDFGTIREIRSISRRIRDHHTAGQRFGAGYDLKRGRGGIREIEFFTQIHQLIHGGRDPDLRAPATPDALVALAGAGVIPADQATTLANAYRLLRTIEHRVQMIDDRQTHQLPWGEALDGVARLHGLPDGDALLTLLAPQVRAVEAIYGSLEPESDPGLPFEDTALKSALETAGFDDPAGAARLIDVWRGGGYPATRSNVAREALESVLPNLIAALAEAPDQSAAIARLDRILAKLPSAVNFFRLLEAQPALAGLLGQLLSHAPPLAEALGRRPELLDGLIDASALDALPPLDQLIAEMTPTSLGDDYQDRLDHVRRIVGERRFALGAQIVAGTSDPLQVARDYATLAEAAIEVVATAAIADFTSAHGHVPGSELVILALGRLGGQALTHASDLDLIFLFTGDYASESDGKKPLGAVLYYNRLAQRISGALSVATASGPLYEVDTRLRPSGNQGPLAVSTEGFARYQQQDAWTWEHMALTRARPVFGSPSARAEVAEIVSTVLHGDRAARDVVADAAAMRADIAAHKPPTGPIDAKLSPGGLVDLEFAIHVAQLATRTGFDPDLAKALALLVDAGVMPAQLRECHDLLMRWLVVSRLLAPDAIPPSAPTRALIARAIGTADWATAVASFDSARQEVARCWQRTIEGTDRQ